ncbi:MAG: SAM-dependent methyltransferase [Ignavibacteriae bacterium]|nr:SAM-dependent methyltransferase [Ignavibacteriota bacterium]
MFRLNKNYWDEKYKQGELKWDIGYVATPLREYFDQLNNKEIFILIPGAGNAYEAEYLHGKGFQNTYVLDWSKSAAKSFLSRYPEFPEENVIVDDFFEHNGKYDLVVEQTFFCAIEPILRPEYARKVYDLLNENGKLVGVLFNVELNTDRPPYGGFKSEYIKYFSPYFDINVFDTAFNSIEPRKGRELFINLTKKHAI